VGFEKVDLSHTYRFVFDREITEGRTPKEEARGSELLPGVFFPQWIMSFLPKNRFGGNLIKSTLVRFFPLRFFARGPVEPNSESFYGFRLIARPGGVFPLRFFTGDESESEKPFRFGPAGRSNGTAGFPLSICTGGTSPESDSLCGFGLDPRIGGDFTGAELDSE
jgi:hypothetical protein